MRRDLASLLLRAGLGVVFIAHGAQKLFGSFGGQGIEGTGQGFEELGLVPGELWAVVAGLGEFGGGILLVLGLLTPLGALSVAVAMAVAIVTTTAASGFFSSDGGWEYNAVLIVAALAVVLLGPGRASLDRVLGLDARVARLLGRGSRGERAPVGGRSEVPAS